MTHKVFNDWQYPVDKTNTFGLAKPPCNRLTYLHQASLCTHSEMGLTQRHEGSVIQGHIISLHTIQLTNQLMQNIKLIMPLADLPLLCSTSQAIMDKLLSGLSQ